MAARHLTQGFPLVVYTDHKNNLYTNSLLANKRMQKKLLRWTLEIEEIGDRVQRIWLAGKENILGDAPSRNPADGDFVQNLPVPAGPVKRVVRAMFEAPIQLEEEMDELQRFLSQLEGQEPEPADGYRQANQLSAGESSESATKDTVQETNDKPDGFTGSANETVELAKVDLQHSTQSAHVDAKAVLSPSAAQWCGKGEDDSSSPEVETPLAPSGSGSFTIDRSCGDSSLHVSADSSALLSSPWPSSMDADVLAHFQQDEEDGVTTAHSWLQSKIDSSYPRFPLVRLLPFSTGGSEPSGHRGRPDVFQRRAW